jgi:uncharacterized protein
MPEPGTSPAPMFPLGTVLLPAEVIRLQVFEPRYLAMTQVVLGSDGTFGVVLISRGFEGGGGDQRLEVGTIARVVDAAAHTSGRWSLLVRGESRLRVLQWEPDDPYPCARIELLSSATPSGDESLVTDAAAAVSRARALCAELGAPLRPWTYGDELDQDGASWEIAAAAPLGPFDRQRILEQDDPSERLTLIASLATDVANDALALLSRGEG